MLLRVLCCGIASGDFENAADAERSLVCYHLVKEDCAQVFPATENWQRLPVKNLILPYGVSL